MKWKDIKNGYEFSDGSKVIDKHEIYKGECYKLYYKSSIIGKGFTIVLDKNHLLLIDINKLNKKCKEWIISNFKGYKIPLEYEQHVYLDTDNIDDFIREDNTLDFTKITKSEIRVKNYDLSNFSENKYWLPVSAITLLINMNQKLICNNKIIYKSEYMGMLDVFCVETDTHKFEMNGLIHHNSVTLRNIIFHCLTHQDEISIALIDLKWTEFTFFKGFKNVVAVANTVPEACELLRLAREVMYKRNQEMSKLGINDIKDFKPTQPTDDYMVCGRKLKGDDKITIRTVDEEEKEILVKELGEYL